VGSENAHMYIQNAENGFDFLELCHKDSYEFLNHITQVIDDETWVSYVNAETKEQSKNLMHTYLPNKLNKFKKKSACQKADGNCFLGKERSADSGSHATRDNTNVRSVLQSTKKLCRAIHIKRHGMLTSGVVLFYDNVHPHTVAHTRELLEHFYWEFFEHFPYDPDLSEQLLYVYLPEELVAIAALQK
jgi:hypothetical protein